MIGSWQLHGSTMEVSLHPPAETVGPRPARVWLRIQRSPSVWQVAGTAARLVATQHVIFLEVFCRAVKKQEYSPRPSNYPELESCGPYLVVLRI